MKSNLLKAEFAKNNVTQRDVAHQIEMSESTFIRRMKNGDFKLGEVIKIINVLHINDISLVEKIFLNRD